jgi:hypothetical protein
MKKGTLLILIYTVVVIALITSIKLAQANSTNRSHHETLVAGCDDNNNTTSAGE